MSVVDTDYVQIRFLQVMVYIVDLIFSLHFSPPCPFPIWLQGFVWRMKGREMTPEERAQRKKERAEIELRRKVNREVRKRKLVTAEDAEKKAPKKKAKATAATTKSAKGKGKTKGGAKATAAAGATKPPRTYFGHVPKPAEDGGAPPLPELPPGGWDTSDRKTRIEAARRAADYYSRMAQKWEEIAKGKHLLGVFIWDCMSLSLS